MTARKWDILQKIWWRHQFPRYWPFVRGIHRSPVNSPHKGQWRGALMFSLICAWITGWVNNREAVDLRRHHAHYDVIVMILTGSVGLDPDEYFQAQPCFKNSECIVWKSCVLGVSVLVNKSYKNLWTWTNDMTPLFYKVSALSIWKASEGSDSCTFCELISYSSKILYDLYARIHII